MCKCNKLDSNISKRTTRYLKRTIKKNNQEILNDKKHIKLLNESLKCMTNYIEYINTEQNDTLEECNEQNDNTECSNECTTECSKKVTTMNNLCKEDICAYV